MTFDDDVRDLYQEVILDHGRRPRHGHRLAAYDVTAKGDNPMCGDRVEVFVKLDGDGKIAETWEVWDTLGFLRNGTGPRQSRYACVI